MPVLLHDLSKRTMLLWMRPSTQDPGRSTWAATVTPLAVTSRPSISILSRYKPAALVPRTWAHRNIMPRRLCFEAKRLELDPGSSPRKSIEIIHKKCKNGRSARPQRLSGTFQGERLMWTSQNQPRTRLFFLLAPLERETNAPYKRGTRLFCNAPPCPCPVSSHRPIENGRTRARPRSVEAEDSDAHTVDSNTNDMSS